MGDAPLLPTFDQLIHGARREQARRRIGRLTLTGIIMIITGALILTLPVTLALSMMPRPATTTDRTSTVSEDADMLKRAERYDQSLIDHGILAVGDAPDPFTTSDATPAYRSDKDYQSQLGAGDDMAEIRIPRISVDMRIGHGTGQGTLETGAGHIYGTTLPIGDKGNTVIAGHRGLGAMLLFYRLGELTQGDLIYTEAAGRTVAWKVDRITRVEPGSDEEKRMVAITPKETRLTLYTCDPPGLNTMRLIIGAHRIPYVDTVSVEGQSDPMKPLLAAGLTGLTALTISLIVTPHTIIARHANDMERRRERSGK